MIRGTAPPAKRSAPAKTPAKQPQQIAKPSSASAKAKAAPSASAKAPPQPAKRSPHEAELQLKQKEAEDVRASVKRAGCAATQLEQTMIDLLASNAAKAHAAQAEREVERKALLTVVSQEQSRLQAKKHDLVCAQAALDGVAQLCGEAQSVNAAARKRLSDATADLSSRRDALQREVDREASALQELADCDQRIALLDAEKQRQMQNVDAVRERVRLLKEEEQDARNEHNKRLAVVQDLNSKIERLRKQRRVA